MKIAIIGAGWFGCLIADELIKNNKKVLIYEKEKDIFQNASGNNQNRLHLGFHYPRSEKTILQSKDGFEEFKKKLGNFCRVIPKNYYFISQDNRTKLDFEEYKSVLRNVNLDFEELKSNEYNFLNKIAGGINCQEELILFKKAKKYFKNKLKDNILYNSEIKEITKVKNKFKIYEKLFDVVINCSWMQYSNNQNKNYTYEYCLMLKYETEKVNHPAITIMDGPFFTLYPWDEKKAFGLYSVEKSRIDSDKNFNKLKTRVKKITKYKLLEQRKLIESEFSEYYPKFKQEFAFKDYLKSFRTIIKNKNDSRVSYVKNNKNFINVFSGKIDHVFYALKEVEKCLKKF